MIVQFISFLCDVLACGIALLASIWIFGDVTSIILNTYFRLTGKKK